MTVHIELSSRQKMPYLLEILKSLDFVEAVRVDDEPQPADATPPAAKRSPFVTKHNGAIPHLDVEAFETHIAQTRNEWTSEDTY